MNQSPRCCNIDWLEVFVFEPIDVPHDADFFRENGYTVHERAYGTRVYRQMFILDDSWGQPAIEIRRDPVSGESDGGILPPNACHIRLTNHACYYNNSGQFLLDFLNRWGYCFQRISRIDVCLDFIRFDSMDYPDKFVRRYLQGKYRKINQGKIHVHGDDTWHGQTYNSVSWGSKRSQVSTKLYNKSLELREVHDKPYIKQAWFESFLVAHPFDCYVLDRKGKKHYPNIWRLEFSIQSSVKGWYRIEEDGHARHIHSFRNNLEEWATREKCLEKFFSLVPHYFRFKYYDPNTRKDRCLDKKLFNPDENLSVYHIDRIANTATPMPLEARLKRLLQMYREKKVDLDVRHAVDVLITAIEDDGFVHTLPSSFTRADILTMQRIIAARPKGRNISYKQIHDQIEELLKLHDIF